jgi:NDP-sugar pyrophosphorylase family protein
MDAIILAGGLGTRLRPLTEHTPKPLVPVCNRPFLATLLVRLKKAGVRRAVLSVFHEAKRIRAAIPELGTLTGLALRVIEEEKPLGTGGAIRFAWPQASPSCLVLNGDVLSDFDFRALAAFHQKKGADASLWVRPVREPSAYGVIESGRDRRVGRFVEKPKPGETHSRMINAGAYLLEAKVLRFIPAARAVSIERETFPRLLQEGLRVFAYDGQRQAYWRDIGTPANYLQANLDILRGRLKPGSRKLWPRAAQDGLWGTGCRVGRTARISASVLGDRCLISEGATVASSVLWPGCRIGRGAVLRGVLLGRGVQVGDHARLASGTVLGDGAVVPPQAKL